MTSSTRLRILIESITFLSSAVYLQSEAIESLTAALWCFEMTYRFHTNASHQGSDSGFTIGGYNI